MKRSMNVNIFLKQFKAPNSEIVKLIQEGDENKIGAERLKGLIKILPTKDEVNMINITGTRTWITINSLKWARFCFGCIIFVLYFLVYQSMFFRFAVLIKGHLYNYHSVAEVTWAPFY